MRWLSTLVLFIVFLPSGGYAATYVYDYNINCSKAYQYYMSMHFAEANALIATELKNNPNNLMPVYLADYEDCITLLLSCDKQEYELRKSHLDTRLELLNKGDERSPWYRLCKAGIYLHWAIVNTRFGEEYRAAYRCHKSITLIRENQKLFPAFEYNDIYIGLKETVAGALPGGYKWLASIIGLSGDLKDGIGKLSTFIGHHTDNQPMRLEAVLFYLYTRFYLQREQQDVWNFINSPQFSTNDNLLNSFVKVSIGHDYHKADEMLATLKAAMTDKRYDSYPLFDYEMGYALLANGDQSCVSYFQQFIKKTKGDIFIKDSWLRMGYAAYLAGNTEQANYCRDQIKQYGTTRADADKHAEKFANGTAWPQKTLLQARLLADGGYYKCAYTLLSGILPATLDNITDKAEYFFRLGNVYEELHDYTHALEYLQYAINTGNGRHEQFAARAALHMGMVYEKQNLPDKALSKYNECLDMPNHDFQNSIDQQAKAGLRRLNPTDLPKGR